ncbi:MAG: DNA-processing protein DprA [Culturomica sp.]|jgi:DNA processing protein|nr:DNA-processing protein DprA [Culturomica sp.]
MENLLKMQVALNLMTSINSMKCKPFIEHFGGIEGLFMETPQGFEAGCKEFNLRPESVNRKKALKDAEKELPYFEKFNISTCSFEDYSYPFLLHECYDSPLVFFYSGELLRKPAIYLAIVGTRKASERCRRITEMVVQALSECSEQVIIVSGLAFGIDCTAHKAALKYGMKTYAVLGHGLHTIYPSAHKNLADQIVNESGCLLSEISCNTSIIPAYFLKRNRIIAGLSHATFIAESALQGGSLSTARTANSYGRDILALPGRPEDRMSSGCNLLIKEQIAQLVENGEDVITHLGLHRIKKSDSMLELFPQDKEDVLLIMKAIRENSGIHIDELSQKIGLSVSQLSSTLIRLELEDKIISLPANCYMSKE